MKKEKTTIVVAGVLIGVISAMLVFFGNPANMGFCIACFLRDTTGALGLHSAAAVQYIRPEIMYLFPLWNTMRSCVRWYSLPGMESLLTVFHALRTVLFL